MLVIENGNENWVQNRLDAGNQAGCDSGSFFDANGEEHVTGSLLQQTETENCRKDSEGSI